MLILPPVGPEESYQYLRKMEVTEFTYEDAWSRGQMHLAQETLSEHLFHMTDPVPGAKVRERAPLPSLPSKG